MLLVPVDLKALAPARGLVGHRLVGQVYLHQCLGIGLDRGKELGQELLADHHGKHKVVQLIVLMYIGKEAADDYAKAIARNGPCRMFTARPTAKVLTCHQYLAAIQGVVQHKVPVQGAVGIVTPVSEEVLTEEALLACGGLQEACWDDLVCIYILQGEGHTGACDDIEFLFHG